MGYKIKLELNEKLWFGKYNGQRLRHIIDEYPHYINQMLNEHNVKLSDECNKYISTNSDPMRSIDKSIRGRYMTISGDTPSF